MTTQHTPTPWNDTHTQRTDGQPSKGREILADGRLVAVLYGDHAESDAEFIVRAVNSHDALVTALEALQDLTADCSSDYGSTVKLPSRSTVERARKALAQARGES